MHLQIDYAIEDKKACTLRVHEASCAYLYVAVPFTAHAAMLYARIM